MLGQGVEGGNESVFVGRGNEFFWLVVEAGGRARAREGVGVGAAAMVVLRFW